MTINNVVLQIQKKERKKSLPENLKLPNHHNVQLSSQNSRKQQQQKKMFPSKNHRHPKKTTTTKSEKYSV